MDRKLKVYEAGDYWKISNGKARPKSKIVLEGNWLYVAGYKGNDRVNIKVTESEIVITKVEA